MGAVWENPAVAAVPGKYRWCLNMAVQYKRILLKVSGEALSGEKGTGFDEATIGSLRTDAGMPVLPFRTEKIEVK